MFKLTSIKDFMSTYLFEMTFESIMFDKIRGLENQINLHLIKIIRYEDEQNFQKHINDLETWLIDIQDLDFRKANNKLKQQDYFNLLFTEPITNVDNIQYIKNKERGKLKKYSNLKRFKTEQETLYILEKLHIEMSYLLSKNDIYDFFINIKDKINEKG